MESEESDIKKIFLIFWELLKFYEGSSSCINIKTVFESAKLLEDTYLKLESIGALIIFNNKLKEFLVLKGLKPIPIEFFKTASEEVLTKYMSDNRFTDDEVKEAIHQFILNKSEDAFKSVIFRLHSTNSSVGILKQMIKTQANASEHSGRGYLKEMINNVITNDGNIQELVPVITKIDSDKDLKNLLELISISEEDVLTYHVQKLIFISINNFLRQPESVCFYGLVLKLSDEKFCYIVTQWNSFSETCLMAIERSIVKLQCQYKDNSYSWTYEGPDKVLSFNDITELINKLKLVPNLSDQIEIFFSKWKQEGFKIIVEDLMTACKIKL